MNYLSYDDPGEDLRGYGGARNWDSALEFLGGVLEQSDYWQMERCGAVWERSAAHVQMLLEARACPHVRDNDGQTPF